MSLNRWIGIGRLVADPSTKFLSNGVQVTTLRLAVERDYKPEGAERRDADFVDCIAWRKLAEVVANNLTKGRLVAVEGRLTIRSYEAKDGGGKKYKAEIQCDKVDFLDKPRDGAKGAPKGDAARAGDEVKVEEDDIPF